MIALFYFVFEGNFQVEGPRGLYSKGRFYVTSLGGLYLEGLIQGGAYFRILHCQLDTMVGVILDTYASKEYSECSNSCVEWA